MSPMSPRTLRPMQTLHPEAASWAARVVSNGGSVSGTTLSAVDRFCKSISSAGIRDRFYRLNLFCGTGLNACLVPLYRGQSQAGTQYGNTVDTNVGPFVSGDYSETSGLWPGSTNTSKHLDTGFPANTISAGSAHLGLGILAAASAGTGTDGMGAFSGSSNSFAIAMRTSGSADSACVFSRFGTSTDRFGDNVGSTGTFLAAGNIVASWPTMYRNGVASGTAATTFQDYPAAHSFFVFATHSSGSGNAVGRSNPRLGWYSIGASMTQSQAAAFSTAASEFYSRLGRA